MSALGTLRLYRFSLDQLADFFGNHMPKNAVSLRPNTRLERKRKLLLAQHFAYGANVAEVALYYTGEDAHVELYTTETFRAYRTTFE